MTSKLVVDEQIKIRQAEIKDVERIAILCEQLGYSVTQEQIKQRFGKIKNNDSHILYVATLVNEYVIGWVQAYTCDLILVPTPALIHGLVIDKDYRYHGVGRLLMQHIEQWASLLGCDSVLIRSNIKRKEAHFFMKKLAIPPIANSKKLFLKH